MLWKKRERGEERRVSLRRKKKKKEKASRLPWRPLKESERGGGGFQPAFTERGAMITEKKRTIFGGGRWKEVRNRKSAWYGFKGKKIGTSSRSEGEKRGERSSSLNSND